MPEMLIDEIIIGSGAITANIWKTLEIIQCRKIYLKYRIMMGLHLYRFYCKMRK